MSFDHKFYIDTIFLGQILIKLRCKLLNLQIECKKILEFFAEKGQYGQNEVLNSTINTSNYLNQQIG